MKFRCLVLSIAVLLSTCLLAQVSPPSASAQDEQLFSNNIDQTIWLSGQVMVDGGSAPPSSVDIVLRCGSDEKARVTSSRNGDFSIRLTAEVASSAQRQVGEQAPEFRDGSGCELYADSPDYVSESVQLFGELEGGMNRVGTIVLHPRTQAQGATVSATSLAAPDKAKKAFEKGREQAIKGKFQTACAFFRRAIEVYPQYAIAWLELGRAQFKQNDFNGAQQSFFEATSHDSRLVGGYEGLADLALQQGNWRDLANSTGKIIEISPDATANVWFLNSAAKFELGDLRHAEESVVRGLSLDPAHRVPQLEYLYGVILARRSAYGPAVQHLQAYLRLAPNAADFQEATEALSHLQKLAATSSPGSTSAATSTPNNAAPRP